VAPTKENPKTSRADTWQRVSVVAVTHHSHAVVEGCLEGIGDDAEVIIIDNASDDGTPDLVRQLLPHANIQENAIGVGYGAGANQGLAKVTREFALLANPDSKVDAAALQRLLDAADAYPDAALLAPCVLDDSGAYEPAHDAELFRRHLLPPRAGEVPPDGPCCADYLSGAVVLLRMASFRDIGPFDDAIFLYYEDDDFCMRIRQKGFSAILVPDALVNHGGGGSVRPSAHYRWEKYWHMAWSRLYLEQKYHGRAACAAIAWPNLLRYALKMLGNGLTLRRAQAWRDLARLFGTAGYLLRVPASRTVTRARPPHAVTEVR
jgi:N-acetylglucosaminyl-diphospho-decaprenol L-rhamnosyltransferase